MSGQLQLLPLTHPTLKHYEACGHRCGNRAALLMRQADFQIGLEREATLKSAKALIEQARRWFTQVHQLGDYSLPDMRLSQSTLDAFRAEREQRAA